MSRTYSDLERPRHGPSARRAAYSPFRPARRQPAGPRRAPRPRPRTPHAIPRSGHNFPSNNATTAREEPAYPTCITHAGDHQA
ncbi:hypothetical protein GCM10010451_48970 [Streptomyces virens]|uniref:Uncharacterized protein n=1 Tax=Streptomyces virens TaxID=285572 RepID=A0ABP6PYH1_9ACTN